MKRFTAILIALALILTLPMAMSQAAGAAEQGELLIASEKVTGAVGDVVKVDFYLYPNLPDGRKLDTIQGRMKYDTEFLTLGTVNQVDEEQNLTSLMKGKASNFQYNVKDGEMYFAFFDAYGVEAEGFWFQAEFRIEKEGATDFVFNGIAYTGIDDAYKAASFVIDPVAVGGVYTEGNEVPEDGAAGETFAPIEPVIVTPEPPTPSPKPSNPGQTVPQTSTLPVPSGKPSSAPTGIVTPPPPQTPMAPASYEAATPANTPAPENTPESVAEATAGTTNAPGEDPTVPGETTPAPIGEDPVESGAPLDPDGKTDPTTPEGQMTPDGKSVADEKQGPNMVLVIGLIVGIVAVIGLGALAIVLILKKRNAAE
jgi:hypothetical protein